MKLTTMDVYVDTIKDFAQRLTAASSPLTEDDLIFHTLRGLPNVFNGLKTVVRTRGDTISFDELVTMLKRKDIQLLKETETDTTTVLVAQHTLKDEGLNSRSSILAGTAQPMFSNQQPQSAFGQQQVAPPQSFPSS